MDSVNDQSRGQFKLAAHHRSTERRRWIGFASGRWLRRTSKKTTVTRSKQLGGTCYILLDSYCNKFTEDEIDYRHHDDVDGEQKIAFGKGTNLLLPVDSDACSIRTSRTRTTTSILPTEHTTVITITNRVFLSATFALIVFLSLVITTTNCQQSASNADSNLTSSHSISNSILSNANAIVASSNTREMDNNGNNNNLEKLIDSIQPRQYFKVNSLTPDANDVNQSQDSKLRKGSLDETVLQTKPSSQSRRVKQKGATISNATLKKLLSQSLLKQTNGTESPFSSGSSKGSNFKFVFIQRATATPASKKHLSSNSTSSSVGRQSLLASSVSKQLASSLLYNAVNSLVSNMTSASDLTEPLSLSALASKMINSASSQPSADDKIKTSKSSTSSLKPSIVSNSISSEPLSTQESSLDIKRVTTYLTSSTPKPTLFSSEGLTASKVWKTTGSSVGSGKRKQSKIYNLPIKFVSNGQPNMVVFHAIKQHFATIKKLQLASSRLHNNNNNNIIINSLHSTGLNISKLTKSRRPSSSSSSLPSSTSIKSSNVGSKLKGNSRLIYLPLRYLSNARPGKVLIGGKATHKSTNM